MKVDRLVPRAVARLQFSLRFRKFVPRDKGCYALATFDNHVLYVGLTENLHERFAQHCNTKSKREPTTIGRAFWFYYLVCAEKDLCRIERTWMNQYMEIHGILPILNRVNSPIR